MPTTDIYFRKNSDYTLDDFCCETLDEGGVEALSRLIEFLNNRRKDWREGHETNDGKGWYITNQDWYQIINLLPSSYKQKRTAVISYRELRNIYVLSDRVLNFTDLGGWHEFQKFIDTLPLSDLISWDTKERHQKNREENRRMMELMELKMKGNITRNSIRGENE